jgi:hypothetical protein
VSAPAAQRRVRPHELGCQHQKLIRFGRRVLIASLGVLIWCLAFRMLIYARLPIGPGDPYGIADMLEWFFGMTLVLLAGLCFALGAFLVLRRSLGSLRFGLLLLVVGGAAPVLYGWLHPYAARLAL